MLGLIPGNHQSTTIHGALHGFLWCLEIVLSPPEVHSALELGMSMLVGKDRLERPRLRLRSEAGPLVYVVIK
jgi:hypothetical protein